jgi:hypothetical protein
MNPEDFEEQLRRQPLREPPANWREQILKVASESGRTPVRTNSSPSWIDVMRDWLWPHPVAWSTLAACWVAILFLHHATSPSAAELEQARREARVAHAYSTLMSHPVAKAILLEPRSDPVRARSERRPPDLGGCRSPTIPVLA